MAPPKTGRTGAASSMALLKTALPWELLVVTKRWSGRSGFECCGADMTGSTSFLPHKEPGSTLNHETCDQLCFYMPMVDLLLPTTLRHRTRIGWRKVSIRNPTAIEIPQSEIPMT